MRDGKVGANNWTNAFGGTPRTFFGPGEIVRLVRLNAAFNIVRMDVESVCRVEAHGRRLRGRVDVVLSGINYLGVREGAWTQRIFGSLKIIGLMLLIGAAIFAPPVAPDPAQPHVLNYHGIGIAVSACLMAYNGWSFVSFVAGEVIHPERNLPRSLMLGMAIVMLVMVPPLAED